MADEPEEKELAHLYVSPKTVYKAVKNILNNECKVDPVEIRNTVRAEALGIIEKEIIDYIHGKGYSAMNIDETIRLALNRKLDEFQRKLDESLKTQIKVLIQERLEEQALQVVGGILKDGLTVQIGWNRKVPVKVEHAN